MNLIYEAVTAEIRSQRNHEETLKLWDRLWKAFESGGSEHVAAELKQMLETAAGDRKQQKSAGGASRAPSEDP